MIIDEVKTVRNELTTNNLSLMNAIRNLRDKFQSAGKNVIEADQEFIKRIEACQSIQEWIQLMQTTPLEADSETDLINELNTNRRASGQPEIVVDERSE